MLEARYEEIRGALVITPLVRRLDAEAAPRFRQTVGPLAAGRPLLIVSLAHVDAVDCSGLAALVAVLKRLAPGGELRLTGANASILALLAATHLDELFPVYPELGGALPQLCEDAGAALAT
jgi:anti-sigma B factor antagonist